MQPHSSKILAVTLTLFFLHTLHPDQHIPMAHSPQLPPPLSQPPSSFASELAFPSAIYSQSSSLDDVVKAQHLIFHFSQSKSQDIYWTICKLHAILLHVTSQTSSPNILLLAILFTPATLASWVSRTYQAHFCSREFVLMVPSSQIALPKITTWLEVFI